ncbi:jg5548 [Pararge aegeria aegeria]|uniref:Jg5548 protein n=1 Tax=Pararge aegeria aegeria TaxID=348720 RepID=A0A8S4QXE6_9NEOP|nr:jg5548 [Pararge aegeria aegeria]
MLNRFWELEAVSSEHCLSQEERACERTFAETTARNSDGRFVVTIPLKDSPEVLGDSYAAAKRRLLSLERRFLRDSLLKERYLQFMSEYLALGHMSENKQIMSDKNINYYLPHHGVIRESSTTTKLRVVFDASAVTTTGKSYNNIQMVGPIVQDDLLSILLRFRQHKYVISGDIEKMYRAILVTPSQRHLQQILFRFNSTEPIKTYTLNTVTYGTSSAPYLATKCLVTLADTCTDIEVKNSIRRDFYVDDYLSGGDSVASVIELAKNVTKIMDTAKFNLRKWQSNNTTILHSITQNTNQQQSEKTLDLNDSLPNKTLGLNWDCNSDNLLFSINIQTNRKKISKRVILSLISQVFDPLGLLGPCTVEAKILMQKLWLDKCNWDDEVSYDIQIKFLNFINSLVALNSLRIPRWVCLDASVTYELHTFTDASERAYGSCVYVRSVDEQGRVCVRLLASKNKVAPLKPVTIPRLELCGALLGTRLCTKVLQSLTKTFNNCYYWTDSMIVLGWLNTSPSRLKTFVRNRIGEIQNTTSANSWSYVPSKLNPADLVSRGVKATHLIDSCLWWTGPSFLHHSYINFPQIPTKQKDIPLPEISLHTKQTNISKENIILHLVQKKIKLYKIN